MSPEHTLLPLIPPENHSDTSTYLGIVADQVQQFIATVYTFSDGYFQEDNKPCHKAALILKWLQEHDSDFNLLHYPALSPGPSPIEHLWNVLARAFHCVSELANVCRDCVLSQNEPRSSNHHCSILSKQFSLFQIKRLMKLLRGISCKVNFKELPA